MAANAEIDVSGQRHYRRKPGMFNVLSRQRLELFRDVYAANTVYPANTLLEEDERREPRLRIPSRKHFVETQNRTIQSLIERGIL